MYKCYHIVTLILCEVGVWSTIILIWHYIPESNSINDYFVNLKEFITMIIIAVVNLCSHTLFVRTNLLPGDAEQIQFNSIWLKIAIIFFKLQTKLFLVVIKSNEVWIVCNQHSVYTIIYSIIPTFACASMPHNFYAGFRSAYFKYVELRKFITVNL